MTINLYQPAIDALEKDYAEARKQASALLSSINLLRQKAGMPPLNGDSTEVGDGENHGGGYQEIKNDQFFGKKTQTAIREYLDFRRQKNLGPASPREIFEALTKGGFEFDAKDDNTAMIGLRAVLRKRSELFVKVGNNYGLLSWYPEKKAKRAQSKESGQTIPEVEEELDGSDPN